MKSINQTLSIAILTHNDEDKIVDCLESCRFADEMLIVDDDSSDRTVELAKNYTRNIFVRSLKNDFATQRNFALEHIHSSWVLFVDSDERVTEELKREINEAISSNLYSGYKVKRIDYMWGRKLMNGDTGGVSIMRLAKKNSGKWHGKVHEVWKVRGKKSSLNNPLIHAPHATVREFIHDVDQYTNMRAEELRIKKSRVSFMSIMLYPVAKFVVNYFFKHGYKDGVAGFIHAMIMSFHSFLVRSKLYLKKNE